MKKQKKQKKRKIQKKEKPCKHQWAPLVAQKGKKIIPVSLAKICLKCGEMKVGVQTVTISRKRLSIAGGTKLQIPVGTNLYS